ncbi:glycosyltransferase [Oleiphilus messinensis]|uniref:Glycosyltransferase n=1 Tax=Oleiphilus messinensis TaxID=141451 RepID=A0A1Y0I7G3_9GAMM|nr:TIGR03087 family PEP-CTERM/XrtA system glycosyltransferase [Oleiphilus messinensis]ARU56170.1 glycosyltransferase [Oleiphilus messinensis]
MNILYVCHRFPFPPKRGGKIRPFNMIKHLSAHGHRVWVASLARNQEEYDECHGIEEFCEDYFIAKITESHQWLKMILNLPIPTPSSMGYFHSRELKQKIDEWLAKNNIDLIFVHCSSVAQYVEDITHIPKILDFGDMDSEKWLSYRAFKPFPLSWGYWWEGTKMARAERKLAAKFDLSTCTTKAELDTLNGLGSARATNWFPNGVDADYFKPDGEPYVPNSISFIGRMDYFPNQECMISFCHNTLPLIKQQVPDVQLFIVGAEPSEEIKKLGEIQGVTVTGSVPDVRPFILRTAAMVAPLNIARGTQNKILEAMAMGVPVVCSSLASGGIDAVANEHFLVADTPEEYAANLVKLMQDTNERSRLAESGRQRVLDNHNWPASMEKMRSIVETTAQSK